MIKLKEAPFDSVYSTSILFSPTIKVFSIPFIVTTPATSDTILQLSLYLIPEIFFVFL